MHKLSLPVLALSALLCGPALATSSTVVSASDSLSTSVDSLSRSIKKSSDSSVRTVVGQGDYRVIQMAQAEAGAQDVTLQALPGGAAEGEFTLRLPDRAVQQGALAVGLIVNARERPYGLEFARTDPHTQARRAFFLLLEDHWYRELQSVALTL